MKKIKWFISVILIIVVAVIYCLIQYHDTPEGKSEHLKLKSTAIISVDVCKWYNDSNNVINSKEGISELQNYINSLELIKTHLHYEDRNTGNCYVFHFPYYDIVIEGQYIRIHQSNDDDKVYDEYYIVESGYNPLLGNSRISRKLDDLIFKYKSK